MVIHMKTIQVIGTGNVGSQIAFGILCRFEKVRLVLTEKDGELLDAQYFDLASANMMLNRNRLVRSESIIRADVYVLTAGRATKGTESRKSVSQSNIPICRDIFERIAEINPLAWVLVVTNPSHMVAQEGLRHLQRVIPMGKMLDMTRARMTIPQGTHESPWSRDIFQDIMARKGYTAFGPAGEVIHILEEIIS